MEWASSCIWILRVDKRALKTLVSRIIDLTFSCSNCQRYYVWRIASANRGYRLARIGQPLPCEGTYPARTLRNVLAISPARAVSSRTTSGSGREEAGFDRAASHIPAIRLTSIGMAFS